MQCYAQMDQPAVTFQISMLLAEHEAALQSQDSQER